MFRPTSRGKRTEDDVRAGHPVVFAPRIGYSGPDRISMKILDIFRRAKGIVLVMLLVFVLGFGSGFAAGKLKWADASKLRSSKILAFNWNLEYKVPGYGALLRKYTDWERPKLMGYIFRGQEVKAMFLIFFNNFVMANLTMSVRAMTLAPMLLYPVGRFAQGLTMAQVPTNYRLWGTLIAEFGGYFLTICGALCLVLWAQRPGAGSRSSGSCTSARPSSSFSALISR
jgi:hypothetical protein